MYDAAVDIDTPLRVTRGVRQNLGDDQRNSKRRIRGDSPNKCSSTLSDSTKEFGHQLRTVLRHVSDRT